MQARNTLATAKNRFIPLRFAFKGMNSLGAIWRSNPACPLPGRTEHLVQLQQQGYFESGVPLSNETVSVLNQMARKRADQNRHRTANNYPFIDLLQTDDFTNPANPVLDYMFSEPLLSAASWYFNGRPRLTRCFLALTKPNPKRDWKTTQLWHVDSDDFKMLRVMLYLSDVDEQTGPFMFVPKSESPAIGRFWAPRMTDAQFYRICDQSHVKRFVGPPGSMLFIDSAKCFHCGSRAIDNERLALVVTFTTQAPCNQSHPLIRRYRHTLYKIIKDSNREIDESLLASLLL